MTDTTQAPTERRSSLLFAIGRLTAEVADLKSRYGEQHTAIQGIPAQVVALLHPQITALERSDAAQNRRLDSLDRWRWVNSGGIGVIFVLVGWGLEVLKVHPTIPH